MSLQLLRSDFCDSFVRLAVKFRAGKQRTGGNPEGEKRRAPGGGWGEWRWLVLLRLPQATSDERSAEGGTAAQPSGGECPREWESAPKDQRKNKERGRQSSRRLSGVGINAWPSRPVSSVSGLEEFKRKPREECELRVIRG